MKAVVQDRYGPPEVLHIEEVERPVPGDDEILIRVRSSTVTQTDTHARRADLFLWRFVLGLRRPRVRTLGVELAGEVEAVGADVREFKVGDEVFGQPSRYFGAHAEYVCVSERAALAPKPAGMSFEEAGAICDGASQALDTLRQAEVGPGRRIVIYGASGSLGTAGIQLAKHFGAHVTAICGTDLSSSFGRSAPTRSSTTGSRTSRRTASGMTRSWTRSTSTRSVEAAAP